jgi:Fur family transcriptional regulator, ferric uptake regulator
LASHDAGVHDAPAFVGRFREYLRRHGLPVTRQRDLIAGTLARDAEHPSAESLARALRSSGAHIGTATVYRTLELMVGAGLARASDFGGRVRRYEAIGGAHGHLVCRRCGRITEFASELLERMMPVLADEHGFMHEEHRIEIHGICTDCGRRDVAGLSARRSHGEGG